MQSQAHAALAQAHELLQTLAGRIQSEALRTSYLTGVPYHRHIIQTWAEASRNP